jgi:FkbM family methyltransferase
MSLRKKLKKLIYGHCPGFAGAFPYYGTQVYFPKNAFIFDIACEEGIYEQTLLHQILGVIEPGSWYFDVGANVGLMSVPILDTMKDVHVVSFEPSPNSSPYLERTWSKSPWQDRWKLVFKAVGNRIGETEYSLSTPNLAGYDGIKPTSRVKTVGVQSVPISTLDEEWKVLGRPVVSCIKLDIEGAEMQALAGAQELIETMRPHIFLEWYGENFRCFGNEPQDVLTAAEKFEYEVVAVPNLSVIQSLPVLLLQMRRTSAFVMVPRTTEQPSISEARKKIRGRA